MHSVSLICTVHEEIGLANVSELRAILGRVQPEVIFLEVPHAAFDDYFKNCSQQNLESRAVNLYRKDRLAELVPSNGATSAVVKAEEIESQVSFELKNRGIRVLIPPGGVDASFAASGNAVVGAQTLVGTNSRILAADQKCHIDVVARYVGIGG